MRIYDYEAAFGAADKTSRAMQQAIRDWTELYYRADATDEGDPCQRIAYTVVNKLVKAVFSEYTAKTTQPGWLPVLRALEEKQQQALQLALVGGECYLKPVITADGVAFELIPRENVLIFGRDGAGEPWDLGLTETSTLGSYHYTLLERRTLDGEGMLTITYRLYRSRSTDTLGSQVALKEHPAYKQLQETCRMPQSLGGLGLVRVKTPMLNCVDGSADGVSVYAAAAGLIRNIDRNEAQLRGEFDRGESRLILSGDLLDQGQLRDHLFVGLDEDPEQVGMTVFSPQLRVEAYLARKQEYLRNVESLVGLRRGMLCDANVDERTATEITSTAADFNLTVMEFQRMWQQAVEQALQLCSRLAPIYGLALPRQVQVSIDWGNGVLYDADKTWQDYRTMVSDGLIAPEVALGWRFDLPADTEEARRIIRLRYMPQ